MLAHNFTITNCYQTNIEKNRIAYDFTRRICKEKQKCLQNLIKYTSLLTKLAKYFRNADISSKRLFRGLVA